LIAVFRRRKRSTVRKVPKEKKVKRRPFNVSVPTRNILPYQPMRVAKITVKHMSLTLVSPIKTPSSQYDGAATTKNRQSIGIKLIAELATLE
tara:strand:+ start:174 stop:449 length:276 start_codon:yes stop_codon:yes gene_type:complete